MTSVDPASAIAATEAFSRFDAGGAIEGWPRPVIALNSDWVPADYRKIRERLPRFDLLVLAGRGHFPNLDDPASFDPVLLATVGRIA
jgi:pimeloyl-ACP methyl ester carboxylesterase